MQRACRVTGEQFTITGLEAELCRKCGVPLPTVHPVERMRRLAAFNNFIHLHRGTCAATGEPIVQSFRPDVPFPVYSVPFWWSDGWDALDHGRKYDSRRPFFAQLADLSAVVPRAALQMSYETVENCQYVNGASYCKSCYLVFNTSHSEDCYFSMSIWSSRDCVDCSSCSGCELCYDCVVLSNCYDVRHSFNCAGCRDSAFLWNCVGCESCFSCVNLRHARYCYMNEQLTPDEYRRRIAAFRFDSYAEVEAEKTRFLDRVKSYPQPAVHGLHHERSTGDYLHHTSNAERCFDCAELRDCANCFKVTTANDCMDLYTWGRGSELIYNSSRIGYSSSRITCSYHVYLGSSDVEYSMSCVGCKSCFGCVGLRNKEHCILNRQYDRAAYAELRTHIIQQMNRAGGADAYGEYLPYELSAYPFNDSDAMLFYPLDRDEALRRGARWAEDPGERAGAASAATLPDRTRDTDDSVLQRTFSCARSDRAFRLTTKELDCYRRRGIPLPREHWLVRLLRRQELINPPVLYETRSAKSGAPLVTSWPPGSGSIVWSSDELTDSFG